MTVRVLIADDSPFARELLREGLSRFDDLEIVGEASDGRRAQQLVETLAPDVVTMDVLMPMVDGLEAIRRIMVKTPTPIVVVAEISRNVASLISEAVEAGAIDVFPKPRGGFTDAAIEQLATLLRHAAHVNLSPRSPASSPTPARSATGNKPIGFIGLVASTGGPQTLQLMLAGLPATFPIPIAIVQHTATGFTQALASWLGSTAPLDVVVARANERARPGTVVVAPDDRHLLIGRDGLIQLRASEPVSGHRPSGTVLLESVARSFGASALGVVLTGMGSDGAEGLRAIEDAGGVVAIEDPESAILRGMPMAARRRTRGAIIGSTSEIGALLRGLRPKRRAT